MNIKTVKTGSVLVSPAIPNSNAHWFKWAYTDCSNLEVIELVFQLNAFI